MDVQPAWHAVPLPLPDDDDADERDADCTEREYDHAARIASDRLQAQRSSSAARRWQALPRAPTAAGAAFTKAAFDAEITATRRDDGAFWIDFNDGDRFRAESPTAAGRSGHGFPSPIWHGTALFTRTPTGLWRVAIASQRAFNLIVYPARHDIHGEPIDRGPEKVCRGCRTSRPVAFFTRNPRNPDGLQRNCVTCSNVPLARRGSPSSSSGSDTRSTAAARGRRAALVRVPDEFKACPVCASAKPATPQFFGPDRRTRDGLQHRCRECSGTVPALIALRRREATHGMC